MLLGPRYVEMLKAVREGPVYPDANGTLRFSYAKVTGYSPRDGLFATPQTTLGGAYAKHTGKEPFDLPEPVRAKVEGAPRSRWADAQLEDVSTCFLSSADTTGGNSGSPVLNGRGELVGLNFDRVWENIAGDFGYSTERSRNVSVDVRFMLFLLDEVEDAKELLAELGLSKVSDGSPEAGEVQATAEETTKPAPKVGCGCAAGAEAGPSWWGLGLVLLLLGRRRSTHPPD